MVLHAYDSRTPQASGRSRMVARDRYSHVWLSHQDALLRPGRIFQALRSMKAELVADNGVGSFSTTCDDLEISRKKRPSWLGGKEMGDSAERDVADVAEWDGTNRNAVEEVKRVLEGIRGCWRVK